MRLSLHGKLWGLLALASAAPLIAISSMVVPTVRTLLEQRAVQLLRLKADSITREIQSLMDHGREDALVLSRLPEVRAYLAKVDPVARREAQAVLEGAMVMFSSKRPIYDEVAILDANGAEQARVDRSKEAAYPAPPEDLAGYRDRYYFVECRALPDGVVYVSPMNDRGPTASRRPLVRYCTGVYGEEPRRLGLAMLNLAGDRILDALDASGLPGAVVELLDEGGEVLARRSADRGETHPPGHAEAGPAGQVHPFRTWWHVGSREVVVNVPVRSTLDRGRPGWRVQVRVPVQIVFEPAKAALQLGMLALVGVLIVALLCGSWISRQVTHPLKALSEGARGVARGDFTGPLPAAGGDEIGELARNFAHMAHEIQLKEEGLLANQQRLASILACSSDAIVGLDAAGRIVTWNEGASSLFGYRAEEVHLAPFRRLFAADPDAQAVCDLVETGREGTLRNREVDALTAAGEPLNVEVSWTRLEGTGELASSATVRDVTQARRSQAHQRLLEDQLHRSERLAFLGQFASEVAHEVGNPLAAMKVSIQAAQEVVEPDDKMAPRLDVLLSEVNRLDRILRGLLRHARSWAPSPSVCDAGTVVGTVLGLLAGQAARRGVSLEKDLTAMTALVDPEQLEQILFNLVNNALDATGRGGRITTRVGPGSPGRILIQVQDTGRGMTADEMAKIFDPFFTTKRTGTGLGLTVAANLARENGGTLTAQSEPGTGTCFSLDLPEGRAS